MALHTHPEYWGEDSLSWRPSRWIISTSNVEPGSLSIPSVIPKENMYKPIRGSYIPWAEGARNCPGKKFAQVEFVAVIVKLLSEYRVRVVPESGETIERARNRVVEAVEDSRLRLTLQMQNPNSAHLTFERR